MLLSRLLSGLCLCWRRLFLCCGALAPVLAAADPLETGFAQPAREFYPRTFWLWMNGNVTRDGITRDLEAMQRVGVSGVMIFDGSTYLPAGPAGYLGAEWRRLMTHAIREGNRLGIDIGMHNAPGWSSSGGPWIQPELAMQQLVWTETTVTGGRHLDLALAQPQTNLGYYRDAFIIAFPALPAESVPYVQTIAHAFVGAERELAPAGLDDGRLDTAVALDPAHPLLLEFKEPQTFHALTAQPTGRGKFPKLRVEASADGSTFTEICTVANPGRHGILAPAVRSFAPVTARFVRFVPTGAGEVAEVVLHRTPRLADWVAKANFDYRVSGQLPVPTPAPAGAAVDPRTVVDLTAGVRDGRLSWDAPAGAWTILRIGHTPTGQLNVAASAAGRGLECDKFNPAAVEFHFQHVVRQVMADAAAVGAQGPATLTIDSYEAGMQNWTAGFPAEFRRRTGYALTPYLPALFGRFVGAAGEAERFLYDFRRVQADLMAEHYYGRMGELAHQHGLRFFIEGYGAGNFDELRVAGVPDVPMTEFWTRTPWTPNRAVKMVTSAAHVYGKPVVAAESFTGEAQTSRWLEYPYALKALGDEMFARGMNLMVFHRYAHQPHPDAAPGMAMGPYGFYFDRTNTWFEHCRPWIDCLARSQFLLQQGTYAADVLYFTGERAPDPSSMALPVLPAGYTYDLVNSDVLLHRVQVRDGAFVLPEGARYRLLVLPAELKGLRPALLQRLHDFVQQGGAILGPKPVFSPTLSDFPASETAMLKLADELWDPARPGPGRILTGLTIGEALHQLGVAPDVTLRGVHADADLSWQHRVLPEGDLFFLGNRQRRPEEVAVSFRGMAGRQAELWQPETGAQQKVVVQTAEQDRAVLALRFEPAESVFVLFRRAPARGVAAVLKRDGVPVVTTTPVPAPVVTAPQDFTMAIWVKPDTDLRELPPEATQGRLDEVGKFYAIPADPSDRRFGAGHATAGLAVGRNGIFVVERSWEHCPAVLVSREPVSGWTHVAVVYRHGRPELYVNGRFVRAGLVSGRTVHPGVGAPIPPVDYQLHFPGLESLMRAAGQPPPASRGQVYFFEGNFVPATACDRAMSEPEIAALAARGLPAPEVPVVTGLHRRSDGLAEALVWASGDYALGQARAVRVNVAAAQAVNGPWHVTFQPGRGAPAAIDLPELQSLHLHADPGVRYFSGTATYTRTLDVPADFLAAGRRVVLDLGRVEVIAEVFLNGRAAGALWKEPCRLDITDAVRIGVNQLEVRVTNLWPNRLIGDEQLPAEDEFGIRDEQGNDPHGITRLPDWYLQGKPKPPGGRVTFATWRFYTKDEPLLASGLLGPVRLLNPIRVTLPRE